MTRRSMATIALLLCLAGISPAWASHGVSSVSADDALTILKEGNARYVGGNLNHPHQNQEIRSLTTSEGQRPFVTILGCSDSRAPVEILFDQGIGDLFVVRVAGNVVDTDEAGSIEYGIDHLGTPVLLILGHTRCGAVTAVCKRAEVHCNIPPLIQNIEPAVAKVKAQKAGIAENELIEEVIKANIWQGMDDLFRISDPVRKKVKEGSLKLVGAVYDIDSGKVEWLGSHPDQDKLISKYDAKGGAGHPKPQSSKKK